MKKCFNCQRSIEDMDIYCPHCGTKLVIDEVKKVEKEVPLKKRSIALLLAFFFGCLGFEDLYLGYKNSFILKFCLSTLTMGILAIPLMLVGLVNFFRILFNKNFKDGYGRKLI